MRELDPSSLEALASSYRLASCIYAAAELGLPDLMVAGARDDEDLAREAGCHAPTLRRVLRMLAAEGVFTEDDDGRFGLTSFSHRLLSNVQDSARSMVLGWHALPAAYRAFGALSSAVRTGENAFTATFGTRFHDYLDAHPKEAAAYESAMESTVEGFREVAASYDFSSSETIVDVGGGQGALLLAVLERYPATRGVLFDLPRVLAGAPARLAEHPAGERIEVVAGDMFSSIPAGGDIYLLSTVLRCFEEDEALLVLNNCRAAMSKNSTLLALEMVVPPGRGQGWTATSDVVAMVVYGGRDRTEDDWRGLFWRAGLSLSRIVPADEPFSLVEAVPEGTAKSMG